MATGSLTRISIWIIYISLCWSTELANITDDPQNLSEITETIEIETTTSQLEMSTILSNFNKKNAGSQIENIELPIDCSQREKLKIQPVNDRNSRLKKCCPNGESLSIFGESQSEQMCDTTYLAFEPSKINAVLYDNCIEDMETEVSLPLEIGNPCNTSFLYTSEDDQFYVLQDGSLLIIDEFGNDTYTVEKKYCLDIDNISGITYAIICITSVEEHLNRSQIMTVAILMLISIPCLLCVSYIHLKLKALRTLHGLSLSFMSLCLATGYYLHALAYLFNIQSIIVGYAVQFFILSYFFWFFCVCTNVLINIWYKIPLNKRFTKTNAYCNFCIYCLISIVGPIILVVLTVQKGLPGMPSYFIQGFTESIRESQRYFIPPISTLLFLSFLVMVASFFGFQRIKKRGTISKQKDCIFYLSINQELDEVKYEEVKKDAKCISLLGLIMITTWLLEVVTFYSPGPEKYLIFMEMINGLQGVFILLIFVVVRRRRTIILRWWHDRGSHDINENVELNAINK